MSKKTLLARFGLGTKKIKVKAWDNEEVEVKQLSVSQKNRVDTIMFKDAKQGASTVEVNVDVEQYNESIILACHYGLVEPSFTVSELRGLNSEALTGLIEIKESIDNWSNKDIKEDKKGNAGATTK